MPVRRDIRPLTPEQQRLAEDGLAVGRLVARRWARASPYLAHWLDEALSAAGHAVVLAAERFDASRGLSWRLYVSWYVHGYLGQYFGTRRRDGGVVRSSVRPDYSSVYLNAPLGVGSDPEGELGLTLADSMRSPEAEDSEGLAIRAVWEATLLKHGVSAKDVELHFAAIEREGALAEALARLGGTREAFRLRKKRDARRYAAALEEVKKALF